MRTPRPAIHTLPLPRIGSVLCLAAALAAPWWLGCNMVTGSDSIILAGDDDDDDSAAGGWTSTTSAGGFGGTGSDGTGGMGASGNTGNAGGAGLGAGGTGGTGAGGSGAAPPTDCPWPTGPSGITTGSTLSEWTSWQGYPEQSSTAGTVAVSDYFDCDGSKGINALLFVSTSWNCGACQLESSELESKMATWAPLGIKVVVLLMRGAFDEPAELQAALNWKNQWGLSSVAVVADPNMELLVPNSQGVPQQSVVDPRTMQVVHVESGYDGYLSQLTDLASQNASP